MKYKHFCLDCKHQWIVEEAKILHCPNCFSECLRMIPIEYDDNDVYHTNERQLDTRLDCSIMQGKALQLNKPIKSKRRYKIWIKDFRV